MEVYVTCVWMNHVLYIGLVRNKNKLPQSEDNTRQIDDTNWNRLDMSCDGFHVHIHERKVKSGCVIHSFKMQIYERKLKWNHNEF